MPNLPDSFNTKSKEKMNDYSVVPEGNYIASVVKSEVVLTKKAKEANDRSLGQIMKLQWKILAGEYKGKNLYTQINIVNPNPQAVEIGEKEFATIRDACGVVDVQQTEQLHGIPCELDVGIESQPNYPDRNFIKFYKEATGDIPAAAPVATTSNGSSGDTPKKKPWE